LLLVFRDCRGGSLLVVWTTVDPSLEAMSETSCFLFRTFQTKRSTCGAHDQLNLFSPAKLKKWGAPKGSLRWGRSTYLDRLLASSVSGGRTTKRPSIGNARSSMLKPDPSLWGKAAPILVHFFPVLPLLSYSSTVKTLR
jgi:hypothetical protein